MSLDSTSPSMVNPYGYYSQLGHLPWYLRLPLRTTFLGTALLILALVAFAIWFVTIVYLRPRYFSPFRNIAGPPLSEGHWLFGEAIHTITSEHGRYQADWNRRFGGQPGQPGFIKTVGPIGLERIHLFSTTALRQVFNDYQYAKPPFARSVLAQITGYGLLTVEDDVHRKMRRDLNPAFATKYLAMQYEECGPILSAMCDQFDSEIGDKEEAVVDAYDIVTRALLDIICLTAFGYDVDSLNRPDEPLAQAYHTIIGLQDGANVAAMIFIISLPFGLKFIEGLINNPQVSLPLINKALKLSNNWYPITVLYKFVDSLSTIQSIATRLLQEKTAEAKAFKELQKDDASRMGKIDILSLIVKGATEDQDEAQSNGRRARKMDARECKAHIMTFLGAGHETTSSGVSWTIWLLANNHEAQRKLRKECEELLVRSPSGHPNYFDLRNLVYLNAVVLESLRVRPSVPATFRKATKDSYIDGVWCPKGTYIAISTYAVNTNPRVWGPDSDVFKPERWLPEDIDADSPITSNPGGSTFNTGSAATRPRGSTAEFDPMYSYMTFIAGNHHCIGKNMALIEMKAVLFQLITKFKWDKEYEGQYIRGDTAITMKPRGGVPVKMKRLTEEEKAAAA